MAETKFTMTVRIKPGALHGWHEDQSAETRHRHLAEAARRDGWVEVSRRLNFISNVASRTNNPKLHRIARADQKWAARREANRQEPDAIDRLIRQEVGY